MSLTLKTVILRKQWSRDLVLEQSILPISSINLHDLITLHFNHHNKKDCHFLQRPDTVASLTKTTDKLGVSIVCLSYQKVCFVRTQD